MQNVVAHSSLNHPVMEHGAAAGRARLALCVERRHTESDDPTRCRGEVTDVADKPRRRNSAQVLSHGTRPALHYDLRNVAGGPQRAEIHAPADAAGRGIQSDEMGPGETEDKSMALHTGDRDRSRRSSPDDLTALGLETEAHRSVVHDENVPDEMKTTKPRLVAGVSNLAGPDEPAAASAAI